MEVKSYKMKTILAITVMTILLAGTIAPVLDAFALKSADTFDRLSPKSFGKKTTTKMNADDFVKKDSFDLKKEQVKQYKKIIAEYNAKQLAKKLYNI